MPLSPEMHGKLIQRIAALGASASIKVTGPDIRAKTVEDAERLVEFFAACQCAFVELYTACTLKEDRDVFGRLFETFNEILIDLGRAISATRDRGVPWEETRDFAAASPRPGIFAAREIRGSGTIDPNITIVTAADHRATKKDPS